MLITELLKERILYLDGGMGTMLQAKGLKAGELPERLNITSPDLIGSIHKMYFDMGSNIVCTNTFGANPLKFDDEELEAVIRSAIDIAKKAAEESVGKNEKFVALDIGPLGKLLRPYGDLDFEDAVAAFSKVAGLGEKHGADLIMIETMNDSYETKAALLGAKESTSLPIFVSNAYGEDGKLMTGASPEAMVAMLEGMGADAIGVNCSLGPDKLESVVLRYLERASVPVLLKPNAGLPLVKDGKTYYDISPDEFAEKLCELAEKGVRLLGGCCGTTPEYIKKVVERTEGIEPKPIAKKEFCCVSSYTHAVDFGEKPILIGERINPTGKKRMKLALTEGDMGYILEEGLKQEEAGADILDVNVGLPGIDEAAVLTDAVKELQAVSPLPLQIDTANAAAMEKALRCYNGKALINSVNGKDESLDAILPLAKKYGGVLIALTLDENGIPTDASGRIAIAEKILSRAAEYGIEKNNIIFDPLAMAVSADKNAAMATLEAVKRLTEMGLRTSLGVSNVSFGLPAREAINSVFFGAAMTGGLSAAIMNPYSTEMMRTYHAYLALAGKDENFQKYIDFSEKNSVQLTPSQSVERTPDTPPAEEEGSPLKNAVIKGLKEKAAALTKELIEGRDPLEIISSEIIPALDTVGRGFEEKSVYLPQLLMSAEAAKSAFEVIKSSMSDEKKEKSEGRIVIATVKGDIHDIGKNIVKLLLQNYGFDVTDLGRDVPPENICQAAIELNAPIVGLSALMTTTVPAMEETIKLLREKAPWVKVVVGGAVLTKEYAEMIGADKYASDAMETVRYAKENK